MQMLSDTDPELAEELHEFTLPDARFRDTKRRAKDSFQLLKIPTWAHAHPFNQKCNAECKRIC